jgi:hypothetical protein
MLNNHVQKPNMNNSQKNLHTFGRAEQKGCHPGSKGSKDQLMISKAICEDGRRRNRDLCVVWIVYQ